MNVASLVLLAVAGYLLYRYYQTTPGESTPVPSASPAEPATSQQQAAIVQAQSLMMTKQAMFGRAQSNQFYRDQGGLLDWHQWNYIYREVRGVDAPQPSGVSPEVRLTLDEWFAVTFGTGLSGWPDVRQVNRVGYKVVPVSQTTGYERKRIRYNA